MRPRRRDATRRGAPRRRAALVLFARVPRQGRVKTRLARTLGPAAALRLHRALLADSAALVRAAARAAGARPYIAWSATLPRPAAPVRPGDRLGTALAALTPVPQGGGDLGARLRRVVRRLIGSRPRAVVVLGSDSPTAPRREIVRAVRLLEGNVDLVLGPARDGGFWLLGARADHPALYAGIPWGTAHVLRATLARGRRLGLSIRLIRPWHDVDRAGDLEVMRRELVGPRRRRAPHTAATLVAIPATTARTNRPRRGLRGPPER